MDASSPHKAVILFRIEVHGVKTKTGEAEGSPIKPAVLATYGIKPTMTLTVNGFDQHECLRKLSDLLNKFEKT